MRRDLREMRNAIDRYKDDADKNLIRTEVGSANYPPDLQTLVDGVTVSIPANAPAGISAGALATASGGSAGASAGTSATSIFRFGLAEQGALSCAGFPSIP